MSLLTVHNLTSGYGQRVVVKDVSFELPAACLLAVLGPNGSGKSTLLKTIAGVLPRQSGRITPFGQLGLRERAKLVAYLPQHSVAEWPYLVREFVTLGRIPHSEWWHSTSDADWSVIDDQLRRWKIEHLADRSILELSGGEFQRTRLAMMTAQQCPLMLLDEPLASMDPLYQCETLRLLYDAVHQQNNSVMMTLHDVNIAARWADRILLMGSSGVVSFGSAAEVLSQANLRTAYGLTFSLTAAGDYLLPGPRG